MNRGRVRRLKGGGLRALDGEKRDGIPAKGGVAREAAPRERRQFVPKDEFLAALKGAPTIDYEELRADIDAYVDPAQKIGTPGWSALIDTSILASLKKAELLRLSPRLATSARAYGPISAAVESIGRKPRGVRAVDLMIAATAFAHDLPLYTLNAKDFRGLGELIEVRRRQFLNRRGTVTQSFV